MKNENRPTEVGKKTNLTRSQMVYRIVMASVAVVCMIGFIVLKMM